MVLQVLLPVCLIEPLIQPNTNVIYSTAITTSQTSTCTAASATSEERKITHSSTGDPTALKS